MIKLKDILNEEMSPREKREFEAAARSIETNMDYISQEAMRLIKLLNKEGLRKSAGEIQKSYKKHILEFGKDVRNITNQHIDEAVNISGNVKWSNPEAKQFAVNAVSQVAKEIGKAQQRAVSVFTSDMKNNKYDNMDLSKAISTGSLKNASPSKRDILSALYYDIRDRFNKYGRRKKN
jgi:hypothetical protein